MDHPKVSTRRNDTELSHIPFHEVVRGDPELYPNRMEIRYQLLYEDFPRRLRFTHWFLGNPEIHRAVRSGCRPGCIYYEWSSHIEPISSISMHQKINQLKIIYTKRISLKKNRHSE